MNPAEVTAVIPTRGNVDMTPVLESLAMFGEVIVYDNSMRPDVAVYARYVAASEARFPVVFTQDDDVILPPESVEAILAAYEPGHVTANMPERFRHDFYREHALVGFGALFDRYLPDEGFDRWSDHGFGVADERWLMDEVTGGWWHRVCDVIFTALTPRILVDVSYADREFASDPDRMYRQPQHVAERLRALELARRVRDQ